MINYHINTAFHSKIPLTPLSKFEGKQNSMMPERVTCNIWHVLNIFLTQQIFFLSWMAAYSLIQISPAAPRRLSQSQNVLKASSTSITFIDHNCTIQHFNINCRYQVSELNNNVLLNPQLFTWYNTYTRWHHVLNSSWSGFESKPQPFAACQSLPLTWR